MIKIKKADYNKSTLTTSAVVLFEQSHKIPIKSNTDTTKYIIIGNIEATVATTNTISHSKLPLWCVTFPFPMSTGPGGSDIIFTLTSPAIQLTTIVVGKSDCHPTDENAVRNESTSCVWSHNLKLCHQIFTLSTRTIILTFTLRHTVLLIILFFYPSSWHRNTWSLCLSVHYAA